MREIKFRAWHKKEKWMAAVSMCDFILGVFIFTGELKTFSGALEIIGNIYENPELLNQ